MRYGWEKLSFVLREPEVPHLIREYWEELWPAKAAAPLDPDFGRMLQQEEQGVLRLWATRDEEKKLVGFVMFHVMPHLASRKTLFALDAGHYLSPSSRDLSEWVGVSMWRQALEALKALGVVVVMAHDNYARPLGPFFKRIGFEPRSTIYWKILGTPVK